MQTLQITQEAAQKAHEAAKTSGKELLENLFGKKVFQKDIKERIHNITDVINELGDKDSEVIAYRQLLVFNLPDHIYAYQELIMIVKVYNEGKTPDYNDSNQTKYEPRFKLSSSGVGFSYCDYVFWSTFSGVGSRLSFLNYDNMKDATSKFLGVYERLHSNKLN